MKLDRRGLLLGGAAATLVPAMARTGRVQLAATTPMTAPAWAVLQRRLIARNAEACEAFYAKYVDRRDRLEVFERWGANDGPDDAAEATNDWAILHALGAPDRAIRCA